MVLTGSPSPSMSVTLQPSESFGFNRTSFLLFLGTFPLSSLLTFAVLQGPLRRNMKRPLNITNPNTDPVSFKVWTTAPKVCPSRFQGPARLIYTHSSTMCGPTPEKSTLARRLKSKVQYTFYCSIQRGRLTLRAQSNSPSNERRTTTECGMWRQVHH